MNIAAGIDFGLRSYKLAFTQGTTILGTRCVEKGPGPISNIVAKALTDVSGELGIRPSSIRVLCWTGSPPKGLFGGVQVSELDCLAKAMMLFSGQIHTVVNFGATKVLVARCSNGEVLKSGRNDKCAAGGGLFLDTVKQLLQVDWDDFADDAGPSEYLEVENTCAVFAESEIISLLHMGKRPKDIAYAVLRGSAQRVCSLVRGVGLEPEVAMVGGGTRNKGLVAAIREMLGAPIVLPERGEFTTAIGASLMATARIHEDGEGPSLLPMDAG